MKKRYSNSSDQNPFGLSIGDLMAALLLIFVLLLSSTLLQLKEESDKNVHLIEDYNRLKIEIYNDLKVEFGDDLKKWNAILDKEDLIVRFEEPEVLFDVNQSTIKQEFQYILNDFFPRYIKVLTQPKFKDNIVEIRIEGHTDNTGNYIHNMELSQDRTRTVLKYILDNTLSNSKDKSWITSKLTANGLSYSKPIANNKTEKGRSLNRRVEFRVRTDAEKQLNLIMDKFSE